LGRGTRRYGIAQCGSNAADQTFAYDPAGNLVDAIGVTSSHKVHMAYDDQGRLEQVTAGTTSTVTATTTYTYDLEQLRATTQPTALRERCTPPPTTATIRTPIGWTP
jgi:YD repeat-containing protein